MIDHELEKEEYDAHVGNDKQVNPDACQYRHVSSPSDGYLIFVVPSVSLSQTNYEESESHTCKKQQDWQQDRECRRKLNQVAHE